MITVKDIREKEFSHDKHGYSEMEVDNFLDAIAEQMEALILENRAMDQKNREIAEKTAAIAPAAPQLPAVEPEKPKFEPIGDEPTYFKNLEATLRETLISAQRIADETVADARKKAKQTVANAEEQAGAILASSKAEADAAKAEAADIRKAIEDYRTRFIRLVEDQAHILKTDESLFE